MSAQDWLDQAEAALSNGWQLNRTQEFTAVAALRAVLNQVQLMEKYARLAKPGAPAVASFADGLHTALEKSLR